MTDIDEQPDLDAVEPVDGRAARRQRNIDAVLDVVLEMFAEDAMFPTMEQAASRSGLSLRSLYRYFADPGELLEAVITRSDQVGSELLRIHAIGQGPLEDRIDRLVTVRLDLHEELGPVFRATVANEAKHERIREERTKNRDAMRRQFELQFAPELDQLAASDRDAVVAAGDLLTQLESVGYLRRHRQLSVADVHATLAVGLRSLLS